MILCERCGTENLNGSRYCDECGAALWLAGKSGGLSLPGTKNNGSDGNGSKDAAATVAQSAGKPSSPLVSEQQTAVPLIEPGNRAHATLVIERGVRTVTGRSEEHTSELQSLTNLVCRLLLEKNKTIRQLIRA